MGVQGRESLDGMKFFWGRDGRYAKRVAMICVEELMVESGDSDIWAFIFIKMLYRYSQIVNSQKAHGFKCCTRVHVY